MFDFTKGQLENRFGGGGGDSVRPNLITPKTVGNGGTAAGGVTEYGGVPGQALAAGSKASAPAAQPINPMPSPYDFSGAGAPGGKAGG